MTCFKWLNLKHVRYSEAYMPMSAVLSNHGANKEFMWIYGAYKHDKVLDRGLDYCLTTPDTCVICIEKRKHSSLDISPRRDESVPVTPKVKCLKYRSSSIDTETEA